MTRQNKRMHRTEFKSGEWTITATAGYGTPAFWLNDKRNPVDQRTARNRLYVCQEAEGMCMAARFSMFPRVSSTAIPTTPFVAYDFAVDRFRLWGEETAEFVIGMYNISKINDEPWLQPFSRRTSDASVQVDGKRSTMLKEMKIGCTYALSISLLQPPGAGRPYQHTDGKRDEQPVVVDEIEQLLLKGVPSHG